MPRNPDNDKLPAFVEIIGDHERQGYREWIDDMIERRRLIIERPGVTHERTELLRGELLVLYYFREKLGLTPTEDG